MEVDGTGMMAKDVKVGMTMAWFSEKSFRTVVDVQPTFAGVKITVMNSESATLFNDTDVTVYDE